MDIPALPGFPVTLFGGKGFLCGAIGLGGTGLGGMNGRRVPGIVAKRYYKVSVYFKKISFEEAYSRWMVRAFYSL